jgi:hypothetical protein
MSKLVGMVAAGLAVASLLLGAAASVRRRLAPMVLVTFMGTLLAVGCAPERLSRPLPRPPPSGEVIVAAGDIADCRSEGAEATAELLEGIDGTVLTQTGRPRTSRSATTPPGVASRTAPSPPQATTSTTRKKPKGTSTISGRPPENRIRATTPTT